MPEQTLQIINSIKSLPIIKSNGLISLVIQSDLAGNKFSFENYFLSLTWPLIRVLSARHFDFHRYIDEVKSHEKFPRIYFIRFAWTLICFSYSKRKGKWHNWMAALKWSFANAINCLVSVNYLRQFFNSVLMSWSRALIDRSAIWSCVSEWFLFFRFDSSIFDVFHRINDS